MFWKKKQNKYQYAFMIQKSTKTMWKSLYISLPYFTIHQYYVRKVFLFGFSKYTSVAYYHTHIHTLQYIHLNKIFLISVNSTTFLREKYDKIIFWLLN